MIGIEIVGCNPKNLGDILMLEASVREISTLISNVQFVVRRHSLVKKVSANIHLKYLPLLKASGRRRHLKTRLNQGIFEPISTLISPLTGYAKASDVGVLIDVCGYKYGGLWGREAIDTDIELYRAFKAQGGKIILLPKTYGPFVDEVTKAQMRELVLLVDLCLVRDGTSQTHLVDAGVPVDRCPVYPDFTATVPGVQLPEYEQLKGCAVVIPNFRMVDAQTGLTEEKYQAILRAILACAKQTGLQPVVLIHDAGKDDALATRLAIEANVPLIRDHRATVIKGLIGQAALVYSDRLHGLINALSQGVPALTSGWSYKYAEILQAYNVSECYVQPALREPSNVAFQWEEVWEKREAIKAQLAQSVAKVKVQNSVMWQVVVEAIFTDLKQETSL